MRLVCIKFILNFCQRGRPQLPSQITSYELSIPMGLKMKPHILFIYKVSSGEVEWI